MLRYLVTDVDPETGTTTVETDVPMAQLEAHPPALALFGKVLAPAWELEALGPGRARYRVWLSGLVDPVWPQLAPRIAPQWAVIPAWSILAGAGDDDPVRVELAPRLGDAAFGAAGKTLPRGAVLPFCLLTGFRHTRLLRPEEGADLYLPPGTPGEGLRRRAEAILEAFVRVFGRLPAPACSLEFEPQSPDTGREKGYAHAADGLLYARFVVRSLEPKTPMAAADLADLIAHELLHHVAEADAEPGSWPVEGLVTYAARRLLVDAGIVGESEWRGWIVRARRDLRASPHRDELSLEDCAGRFGSKSVARLAYAKGFLVALELDAALGGRLMGVVAALARLTGETGAPFPATALRDLLPAPARLRLERWQVEPGALDLLDRPPAVQSKRS